MNKHHHPIPELLAPAGNISKLRVAIAYGADAVYAGAAGFSMRPDEVSFNINELAEAVDYVHSHNKKIYVGVNAMMFQEDIIMFNKWLAETKNINFDALIVSDAGAVSLIKELRPDADIHISTQMNTANSSAALFWKKLGANRVILARECTLTHAEQIAKESSLETEIFVHGAMCMAVSGRCILSAHLCGESGLKGECKQSCRWEWQLVEEKRPDSVVPVFETGRETIFLGAKDLCLIGCIPEIIKSKVCSIKIEGRMKSESYVAAVTRVYRAALDAYADNTAGYEFDPNWISELEAVSHRPYSTGFAFGYPKDHAESMQTHNKVFSSCEILGVVEGRKNGCYEILTKNPFSVNDTVEWIGPGMLGGLLSVESIRSEKGEQLQKVHGGYRVSVSFTNKEDMPDYSILRKRTS